MKTQPSNKYATRVCKAAIRKNNRTRAAIIYFILAIATSCQSPNTGNRIPTLEKEKLLEVKIQAFGPIYPPGETLVLRVFNNSEVEFDYYPPYTPKSVGKPFQSTLKSSTISAERLVEFRKALVKLESENSKDVYDPTKPILDSKVEITVLYRSTTGWKRIVINENDSHMHSQRSDVYPFGLIKLMELVDKTNIEQTTAFQESK